MRILALEAQSTTTIRDIKRLRTAYGQLAGVCLAQIRSENAGKMRIVAAQRDPSTRVISHVVRDRLRLSGRIRLLPRRAALAHRLLLRATHAAIHRCPVALADALAEGMR